MSEISSGDKTLVGPSMGPKLEVTRGENAGEVFKVKLATRIGRERDNDVILLDLRSSRHHLEINLAGGEWVLTDLGSANGTRLNNEPVTEPVALKSGDRITVGETEMIFRIPGQRDEETAPVAAASGPPAPAPVPRRGAASGAFPAAQRRPPSRLVWIAGGVVLLLCVLALAVVTFTTSRFTGSQGSTQNVPAATRATASNKSTPATVDAAGSQNDDQSVPGRPAKMALVYEEDYSDSFSGWDDAFDAYTRKVYGNNRYNIEVAASNLVAWGLANRIVADFEIEVEGKLEDGDQANSYGLLFRFKDRDNFYRFDISADGFFLFSKFIDGEWITLADWTESEFIHTGKGATNILKVSAFGPDITLWVNGQKLTSVSDDSFSRGNFGFFTGTFAEPYSWVSFDNLKMWTRPNEEIVLIPTATPPGAGAVSQASSPLPSPLPPTPEPAAELVESGSGGQSPVATPVVAVASPTPQPTPTNTPEPLPEYASRSQTLARGERQVPGKIVFPIFDTERGTYDIYAADVANGDNRTLIQADASQPALTVDGTEIAYRSWQPDNRGLFARKLTDDPVNAWKFDLFFESARPQYSPVNNSLMFHSRSSGKEPAIYEVLNGVSVVKRREGAPIQGKSLKWSPDGNQFVYNGCIGGSCGIMISNIDSTNPTLLTNNPTDTNPEISPDGSAIVFMSDRAGNWEIYRMDMNGDNLEALTSDKSSDGLPTWAPDGSKIAFVSNRDGEWSVWIMNPDGSNKRRQFVVDGQLDGIVATDPVNSFGWVEENIDWIP